MTNNRYPNHHSYNRDRFESTDRFDERFVQDCGRRYDDSEEYVDIYRDNRARSCDDRPYRDRDDRRSSSRRPAPARRRNTQGVVITAVAFALIAVIAAGVFAFGAFTLSPAGDSSPTLIVTKADKNAQNGKQIAEQTAAKADGDQESGSQQSQDRIDTVNGERVYIDTKRTAPDGSGTPAHFYAYGKTSYGFDWNYDADNGNFVIRCDYNFDRQEYDFQFYGTAPGTANITVFYNTDDNTQASQALTLVVDDNLNASIV